MPRIWQVASPVRPFLRRFLENRTRGSRLNRQIVDLVVTIAEAAQQNNVPRNVCLNAADGLRVLATGVTVDEQAGPDP